MAGKIENSFISVIRECFASDQEDKTVLVYTAFHFNVDYTQFRAQVISMSRFEQILTLDKSVCSKAIDFSLGQIII